MQWCNGFCRIMAVGGLLESQFLYSERNCRDPGDDVTCTRLRLECERLSSEFSCQPCSVIELTP